MPRPAPAPPSVRSWPVLIARGCRLAPARAGEARRARDLVARLGEQNHEAGGRGSEATARLLVEAYPAVAAACGAWFPAGYPVLAVTLPQARRKNAYGLCTTLYAGPDDAASLTVLAVAPGRKDIASHELAHALHDIRDPHPDLDVTERIAVAVALALHGRHHGAAGRTLRAVRWVHAVGAAAALGYARGILAASVPPQARAG
jgi:hypothetical protein